MVRVVILFGACISCLACAADGNSFERHSLSRLSPVPGSGTEYVFETRAVPGLDRDAPAAEAVRMQWLSEWLAVRSACGLGYEVTERRQIARTEDSFYNMEFRYAVRCRPAPAR